MATRQERERDKKASLLAAAEQVFTSKGYADATLDEIIKLADTGKGTVYRYFGNKENLFYQLVLAKHEALMKDLWELARRQDCSVPDKLRLLSSRWLHFLSDNKVLWPVVGNEMTGINKGVVGDVQPDGTYRECIRWGSAPPPDKLEQMLRYQRIMNEETEPIAAVYREGLEQGLFRTSAQHQDIAVHLFFSMAMVLFIHPDPDRILNAGGGPISTLDQLADNIITHFLYGMIDPKKREEMERRDHIRYPEV
jgi:AcrR family transcriptional regulator